MASFSPRLEPRFGVIRHLGCGSAGDVYLVEDRTAGPPPRALKVARRRRGVSRARLLRHEFEIARRLSHPGLARVHDFGEDRGAGLVWMTSEFVPGPDILRASASWEARDLLEALIALAEILQYLHERKVLHNDLKPSNIRVPAGPGSARLVDFGMASSLDDPASTGGTPLYMPPERLGGSAAPPSAAADLYGLGAVIYHCAVRRPAFDGETPAEVLAAAAAGPVRPRILRPDLSSPLDRALVRLLAADPGERYGSAADLLLEMAHDGARSPEGGGSGLALPTGGPLVGRADVVEELRREAGRTSGTARAVLLTGEAGMGKSRLLDELRQLLELEGWAIIAARGQPGATGAWHLLAEITRQLGALTGAPTPPPDLTALSGSTSPTGALAAVVDVGEAFGAFVKAVARTQPVALLVDDLDWGDPCSVSSLIELAGELGGDRLAVYAATRGGSTSSELPQRWRAAGLRLVHLAPLPDDAQRTLLASLFPAARLPEKLLADAAGIAAGNPLALEEIARAWVDAGIVTRSSGVWTASGASAAPLSVSATPRHLISGRLRTLDARAFRAVLLVALHGRPLSRRVLEQLQPDLDGRLPDLRQARFLVETPAGLDVRHPLVREAVVSAAGEADTRTLSLALGDVLEREGAPSEELWAHLLRGGDRARGVRHGLLAGLRAEATHDHSTGRSILEAVLQIDDASPGALRDDDRRRLWEALAVCLDETGDRAAAAALFERALSGAAAPDIPRLRVKLGRLLYRLGDFERSEQLLRQAEQGAGDPIVAIEAATSLANLLAVLGRAADGHAICVRYQATARALESRPDHARVLAQFYVTALYSEVMMAGPQQAIRFANAALRVAKGMSPSVLRTTIRCQHSMLLELTGRLDDALEEMAAAEREHPAGSPAVRLQRASVLQHRGDSRAALACLELIRRSGVTHAVNDTDVLFAEAEILAGLGDPVAAVRARDLLPRLRTMPYALAETVATGLRAALWTGQREVLLDLENALDGIDPGRAAPFDQPFLAAARGMQALLRAQPAGAVPLFEEASSRAADLAPLYVPRWRFHQAYALAMCGKREEALSAVAAAATLYERLGNRVEQARARALAEAIAEERPLRPITIRGWMDRLGRALALVADCDPADSRTALCQAVAAASCATGVWLVGGLAHEADVLGRAGPCAVVDPLPWRDAARAVLRGEGAIERAGTGLVVPVILEQERAALVVEDRAYPQAFSQEAGAVTARAVPIILHELERRRALADLGASRRALARPSRSSTPAGRESQGAGSSVSGPAPADVAGSRLVELTLGPLELRHQFTGIVGRSPAMRRVLRVLDRMVELDATVLLVGETGTGKELFARALHDHGPRTGHPFVAVNCSAIPSSLAESELFGSAPGAFTGAPRAYRPGFFEQASRGTLFLDEVGDLDPALQAKLLRALETGEVRPLGAESAVRVDVRIVAATHRDLRAEVAAHRFREDLFFRLAVVEVRLPPLRDRPEDIPALARQLLPLLAEPPPRVAAEALDALCAYAWPGNVRELRNEIERATAFCEGGVITLGNLSAKLREPAAPAAGARPGMREALKEIERRMITDALRKSDGNKTAAARALGLTRMGLHFRMERRGLLPPSRKSRKIR